jgi:hypothetical protein
LTKAIPKHLLRRTMVWKQRPAPDRTRNFSVEDLINRGKVIDRNIEGSPRVLNALHNLPDGLEEAMNYAGPNGVVASLPYLIAGKSVSAEDGYLMESWNSALSEEHIGTDRKGRFVKAGSPVTIVVHGGGILTPDRIRDALADSFVETLAPFKTSKEFDDLLEGRISDGIIPIYSVDDVYNGRIPNPFGRYAVFVDPTHVDPDVRFINNKEHFMKDPLVLARAGTEEYLQGYFDKVTWVVPGVCISHMPRRDEHIAEPYSSILAIEFDSGGFICQQLNKPGRFVALRPEGVK